MNNPRTTDPLARRSTIATKTPMPSTPLTSTALNTEAIQAVLKGPPQPRWWRRPVLWVGAVCVLVAAGGITWWVAQNKRQAAPTFVTEAVSRGKLTLSVNANGTLQPTRSVNVGSELSGTVLRVLVDVNDRVQKGQVLVELDTSKLKDQVARSRAALSSALAKVTQTEATRKEVGSNLDRLQEVSRLSGGKVPSKAELDTAVATLERAQADGVSAHADVASARASVSSDETNLSRGSIRSPINGVVLTRSVDPGNAVAASLQAVTLFSVAEDLAKLRLQVNVDEADVGSVQVGQKASFTVSAYPARKYPATITRVAYGSTTTDNVVTYVTYLEVDNADLSLRPGMTAASTITATERQNALLVPNTALRFEPSSAGAAAPGGGKSGSGIVSSLLPRMPGTGRRATAERAQGKQVWVLRNGAATAVSVTPGISDGRMTEITAGPLEAGMLVITDQRAGGAP